jgi:IS30 family transposase
MTYISNLLRQIAKELNKPESSVNRFVKILEENWYDSEPALKEVSEEELTNLGIPRFLAKKIKQKVDTDVPSKTQPSSMFSKKNAPQNTQIESNKIQEETPQGKPEVKEQTVQRLFKNEIEKLIAEILHLKTRISCLEIIQKVIKNLIKDPENKKFHCLKMSNKKLRDTVFVFKHARTVLQLVGFREEEVDNQKVYLLQVHGAQLENNVTVLNNLLAICLPQLQQQVDSSFDPYKASFKSNTPSFTVGTT